MSLIDDLRKFSARTWPERRLFIEAYLLLGLMRAAILLLPFRRITGMMGLEQGSAATIPGEVLPLDPVDVGWAVQAAAARTLWQSTCLVQALAGMSMLGRRGIAATLYLGVGRNENGEDAIDAHAWLRCGKIVLTGAGEHEKFSVISAYYRPSFPRSVRNETTY